MKKRTLLILVALVIATAIFPLLLSAFTGSGAEFTGADGLAEEVIAEIDPEYEPWFKSIYEPASVEIESLLFALQAALGAGLIGFYLGNRGRTKSEKINAD